MFKDLTLGQYYPVDSFIHRLDPRAKLLSTLLFLISLFVTGSWWGFGAAAVYIIIEIALSRISLRYMLRGLKGILFLMLFTVLLNLFLTPGELIASFWFFRITREGVISAGKMALRLILLLLSSSLLTYTTTPTGITDGLERGLSFLKVVKVPVHEIAMMMSIALRFLPVLTAEVDKIERAQMARGADFESGNIVRRAKALIPVLVPLLFSAFRRAGELATAMEARCYHGGEGRTRMKPLRFQTADYLFVSATILYFALMFWI
ncbi:MAG: energy-coupling factor transporter transmembrane protein EcfT [Lachnospiraceae bacterium]|nr:energy-coupling factor transporter transmembrane protein EcfT [Lachnospiraceae bacterium]